MAGYDERLGGNYAALRRPDPRIAAQIRAALGDVRHVVNVGAGAGSYEPADLDVVAVEPSAVMRAQRPAGAAPCLDARAEDLPFADQEFDAALAVLTVHHWAGWRDAGETREDAARRLRAARARGRTWGRPEQTEPLRLTRERDASGRVWVTASK